MVASSSFVQSCWTPIEQFVLIFVGFVCMGAACGFERSLLPRMAIQVFHVAASKRLSFVATFGLSKALANMISGPLSDRFGRKPMLVLGCLVGLPVMPYVILAKSWFGITLMNGAFGLSQGLLGSSLFFLIIDLMGPQRRGVAVGVGECTIYLSTAVVNVLAGKLASNYGYRPVPFYVATGFAIVGLLSTAPLKDTLDKVRREQSATEKDKTKKYARMLSTQPSHLDEEYTIPRILSDNTLDGYMSPWKGGSVRGSVRGDEPSISGSIVSPWSRSISHILSPRSLHSEVAAEESQELTKNVVEIDYQAISADFPCSSDQKSAAPPSEEESSVVSLLLQAERETVLETLRRSLLRNPSYMSLCLAGLVLNFKDGFAWGSFPVFFKHEHSLSDGNTDLLVALYPLCWGFAQAFTGALSDRYGRKTFLVAGMASCAVAMGIFTVPTCLWGIYGDSRHVRVWVVSDFLLGIGTALIYPALQAAAADEVNPLNRGLALGFYRFVRDMGYVFGALTCGHLTDMIGYEGTFLVNSLVLTIALLILVFFYTPKSEEDAARSIWFANAIAAFKENGTGEAMALKTQEQNVEQQVEDEQSTPKVSSRIPSNRTLVSKCSDSW